MRGIPSLVIVALILPLWAGCLEDDMALTKEEAPEGRNSLRVGTAHEGEHTIFSVQVDGLDFEVQDGDFVMTPAHDEYDIERRVTGGLKQFDAFLRTADAVAYEYKINKITVDEGEPPGSAHRALYELASGRELAMDVEDVYESIHTSCSNRNCEETHEWVPVSYTYFPRDEPQDARWDSLEGKVLILGETLSLHRDDAKQGVRWFRNYTALREEWVGETRTFVIEPSGGIEIIDYEAAKEAGFVREEEEEEEEPEEPEPSEESNEELPPLPESVNLMWVSAQHSMPVQEETRYAYYMGDELVYYNSTAAIRQFTPGTKAVAWGSGTPLPVLEKIPEGKEMTLLDLFKNPVPGLAFDYEAAKKAASDDAFDPTAKDYFAAHPNAVTRQLTYLPVPHHDGATWTMFFIENGEGLYAEVQRRASAVPVLPPDERRSSNEFQSEGAETPTMIWVDAAKAVEVATRIVPWTDTTAIEVSAHSYRSFERAVLTLFEPAFEDPGNPLGPQNEFYDSKSSVSVNLMDGGLDGLNMTRPGGIERWGRLPIQPFSSSLPFGVLDPAFNGFDPRELYVPVELRGVGAESLYGLSSHA